MKALGFLVAAFAVLAAIAGQQTGDQFLYIVAGASLICALTTWLSSDLSTYLKIFSTIFSIETIVFGLGVVALHAGFWPEEYKDYALPESLPLTVSMFSILVFVVARRPVVQQMTRIADLYFQQNEQGFARIWPFKPFQASERKIAIAMVIALVLINQAQVAITVRLSFFNRDWFNAIQGKDADTFWRLLFYVFVPWAMVLIFSSVLEFVLQSMLVIRWRKWLTELYTANWLNDHTHYRMALAGGEADNPDQRIAEDVNRFIDGGTEGYGIYSYTILLISTLSSLVSFAIVLWGLSGNYAIPGTNMFIPGFLFWIALIYATIGTLVTHWIGRSLVGIYFQRQKVEADFRFGLARLREYTEQVALLAGENAERQSLGRRFQAIIANYLLLVDRRKKLMAFTSAYGQISPIIPYIFTAPFYFAGKIQLGVMTQTAQAFGRVESALTFFITYYTSLAGFKSVVDRLTSFDESIARAHGQKMLGPKITRNAERDVIMENLELDVPNGRKIISAPRLAFRRGESTLISGPSGSGKSTLLRAASGIWPYGRGEIKLTEGAVALVLPQRPYLPNGSLRAAVAYPSEENAYPDADVISALEAARLPGLVSRLDERAAWSQRLSGGEQQRLAIARALLAKPDWLLLDEATAALDEKLEAEIYAVIAERLPQSTIISIGHRSTLNAMHQRRIELTPDGAGGFLAASIEGPPVAN